MSDLDDRTLLMLAAEAAHYPLVVDGESFFIAGAEPMVHWNPLLDDGQALRLCVKVAVNIQHLSHLSNARKVQCGLSNWWDKEVPTRADPAEATRRAIVHAAAMLGAEIVADRERREARRNARSPSPTNQEQRHG